MTARRYKSLDKPDDGSEASGAAAGDEYSPNVGQADDVDDLADNPDEDSATDEAVLTGGDESSPSPKPKRRPRKKKKRVFRFMKRGKARRRPRGRGRSGERLASMSQSASQVAGQPLAAVGTALLDLMRALGKLIATVWRLAGALDAALWNGLVVIVGAVVSVFTAAIRFLALSAIDFARWLPTPSGRAYVAGSSVVAIIAGLWILDEMRGAAIDAGASSRLVAPPQNSADPVIAHAGGRFIRLSEITAAAEAAGRLDAGQTLTPKAAFETGLVQNFVEQRVLSEAAVDAGVNRDPVVAQKIAIARERILAAAYLEDRIAAATSSDRLKRLYDSQSDLVRLGDEVRARHIVVETEIEAAAIVELLNNGDDFAALARARSLDRATGPRGGDIGYFTRHMMTPVLANAAFTTSVGDYAPLFFSPYGWHVLEVLDRRPAPSVRFEAVEERIKDFITEKTIADTVEGLTRDDEIVYFEPETPAAGAMSVRP
ncbi:MAG: peptidylprolyl isomerase [Pseudomonadota bacterium]